MSQQDPVSYSYFIKMQAVVKCVNTPGMY